MDKEIVSYADLKHLHELVQILREKNIMLQKEVDFLKNKSQLLCITNNSLIENNIKNTEKISELQEALRKSDSTDSNKKEDKYDYYNERINELRTLIKKYDLPCTRKDMSEILKDINNIKPSEFNCTHYNEFIKRINKSKCSWSK